LAPALAAHCRAETKPARGLRKWLELNADCWLHGQTILIGAPGMERLTARNCIFIHLRVAGGFGFRVVRNEREPLW
jgi:hypothetical protein